MGCSPSTLAVAELNKSLKPGDDGHVLLGRLEDNPWLLSTATSVLTTTAGTPLHVACERKHVEAVQKMIYFLTCSSLATVREALQPYCRRAGISLPSSTAEGIKIAVNMVNCKGQTPLMYACAVGSPELVKLLMAQGADPWVGDRCGCRTALHYASMSGSAPCIEALMAHLAPREAERQGVRYINARSMCGLSALHYGVFFEHVGAVEELLRHDPAINAATTCDSYDVLVTCDPFSTPLHFAAVRGNLAIARILLQHFALHSPGWDLPRSQDPRLRANYGRQLPWQVAASHHPAARELVALLHPGQPLERALGLTRDGQGGWANRVGPPPLAALAAAALRDKLLADLAAVGVGAARRQCGQKEQREGEEGAEGEQERLLQASPARSDSGCSGCGEEGLCGVCFGAVEAVAPAGCGHAVCGGCAEALARGMVGAGRPRPLACPFCRRDVAAFVAVGGAQKEGKAEEAKPAGGEAAAGAGAAARPGSPRLPGSQRTLPVM